MANYNSAYTGAQHDLYVTKQQLIDLIYPIGAIYISATLVNPGSLFGGTWVQIKDRFLLSAGDNHAAGAEGGKEQYTADDMPAHTHTRGTMNITGTFGVDFGGSGWCSVRSRSGAFAETNTDSSSWMKSVSSSTTAPAADAIKIASFDASRSWEGETSQSGLNETATITPPHLVVYMWKRVA